MQLCVRFSCCVSANGAILCHTLQSSVRSCKSGLSNFFSFNAQLSPVCYVTNHTVESEFCASAIIMIVPKASQVFRREVGLIIALSHKCLAAARGHKVSRDAWCGGSLTHSGKDAQTDVRFRPALKRHVCISSEAGGS